MLDWIAGYVARWSGLVPDALRSLVQWAVHALASVVYTVFGNVGDAWRKIVAAVEYAYTEAKHFAYWTETAIRYIVHVYIVALYHRLIADITGAIRLANHYYQILQAGISATNTALASDIQAVRQWADTHIFAPLTADIRDLWTAIAKYAVFSYHLLTHPELLAPLLVNALIKAAEDVFWDIAAPVGEFAFRVVVKDLPRWLRLAETIITAVL